MEREKQGGERPWEIVSAHPSCQVKTELLSIQSVTHEHFLCGMSIPWKTSRDVTGDSSIFWGHVDSLSGESISIGSSLQPCRSAEACIELETNITHAGALGCMVGLQNLAGHSLLSGIVSKDFTACMLTGVSTATAQSLICNSHTVGLANISQSPSYFLYQKNREWVVLLKSWMFIGVLRRYNEST